MHARNDTKRFRDTLFLCLLCGRLRDSITWSFGCFVGILALLSSDTVGYRRARLTHMTDVCVCVCVYVFVCVFVCVGVCMCIRLMSISRESLMHEQICDALSP